MTNTAIFYDSRKHKFSEYLQHNALQKEKWIVRIISSNEDFYEECDLVPEKKVPLHSMVAYLQTHLNDLIPDTAVESYFTIEYTGNGTSISAHRKQKAD